MAENGSIISLGSLEVETVEDWSRYGGLRLDDFLETIERLFELAIDDEMFACFGPIIESNRALFEHHGSVSGSDMRLLLLVSRSLVFRLGFRDLRETL